MINENKELEFLNKTLAILRRYRLDKELFPELTARGVPYFIINEGADKFIAQELYDLVLKLYGEHQKT